MNQPPEWLQIAGLIIWSAALTIGVFWQPRWMHRLFAKLVNYTNHCFSFLQETQPTLSREREIEIEAGITTYTFVNGVEKRRPAFPWSAFNYSTSKMIVGFNKLQQSIQDALFGGLKPFVDSIHRSFAVQPLAATRDLRPPASPRLR